MKRRPVAPTPAANRKGSDPLASVGLQLSAIADIAVESWRLSAWAAGSDEAKVVPRHVARQLARVLHDHCVETLDLTGKPYDVGLAAEVLESLQDPHGPVGQDTVDETVTPIVLLNGVVIRHGRVVVRRGTQ